MAKSDKEKGLGVFGLEEGQEVRSNVDPGDDPGAAQSGEVEGGSFRGTMNYRNVGIPGEKIKEQGRPDPMTSCIIRGEASGVAKKGKNQNGEDSWCLTGQFEGVHAETGEIYYSGQLFLPSGIHEMLTAPFLDADEDAPVPSPIIFSYQIDVIRANNKSGYSLVVKSLLPVQRPNRLQQIRDMEKKFAALPKPQARKAIAS